MHLCAERWIRWRITLQHGGIPMQTILIYRFHPIAMMLALSTLMIGISEAQDEKPEEKEKVDVATLIEEGSAALKSEDFAAAAAKFKQVTELDKSNGMAWHYYGYALHGAGKLDEAIPVHKKAAKFDEVKGISLYNLGCAYSLQGKTKDAIQALHQALDAKFDKLELIAEDSDLANVRKAKGYKAIANRVKNGGARPPFNPKKMIGSWNVSKGVRNGQTVANERLPKITIDAKAVTIPAGPETFVMSYTIDNSKRPAHIDMKITAGPAPQDSKAVGIVRKSGKKLMMCYDPTGAKRPEKFESTEDNGFHMFVMELDAEEAKDDKGDDEDEDDSPQTKGEEKSGK